MSIPAGCACITAPIEFDLAKFVERYDLLWSDYEVIHFNGETWIKMPIAIAERIGPHPVFEP